MTLRIPAPYVDFQPTDIYLASELANDWFQKATRIEACLLPSWDVMANKHQEAEEQDQFKN